MLRTALFGAALLSAITVALPGHAADQRIGLVFFTEWSALIDDPARDVVQHSADAVKAAAPSATVTVTGYADTTGSKEANELLSATRAQVVIDLLVADGVDASRIRRAAQGATPDVGGANESRRVLVTLHD